MSKREKRIARLLRKPVDMRFDEVKLILEDFGYICDAKNQTGSHFVFFKGDMQITIPAHNNIVKKIYLKKLIELLGLEE